MLSCTCYAGRLGNGCLRTMMSSPSGTYTLLVYNTVSQRQYTESRAHHKCAIGRNLPTTDVQPADDVGLAAVQLILIQYHSSRDETLLFKATTCLDYILTKSPVSAHASYLLKRAYRLMGKFPGYILPIKMSLIICLDLGAPSLVLPSGNWPVEISEGQYDTLMHSIIERGAVEAFIGGTRAEFDVRMSIGDRMYERTATDVR
jgi:N-terminal acetyltransferase B complex non-catalytic subunit